MNIQLNNITKQDASIKKEILNKIEQIIDKGSFILGEEVSFFEQSFATISKSKYAIGCSNGTDALIIALKTLGVQPGDEVITVPNTFIATAEAIGAIGAKVVFADVDETTMLMDYSIVEPKINNKTKAIIPVHLYGQPVDIDEIISIADNNKIRVVFDCAQAHMAEYKGRSVSEYGDMCTYSFFPGKNLGAYGDAGCVTTNNEQFELKARQLTNHGRNTSQDKYRHAIEGFNSRLDSLQAGILNVKLKHLNSWTKNRQLVADIYKSYLNDIEEVQFPFVKEDRSHVYHLVVVKADCRDELALYLKENGVQTGIHYPIPLHLQPAYEYLNYKKGDFPVAEKLSSQILSLPTYPSLTEKEIVYITDKIKAFYRNNLCKAS
ncbi:MAG: hypothetical protein DKM50_04950 [Candidatus Margulisiibacteriota bacterium]|nr:MAG: hypothetical protein DKM50_04950 [Candidatus Margulisiibacteriota bacterium]HCY37953.1 hypothetical protein [Candidatus Margulisiibacteriota bacterium]